MANSSVQRVSDFRSIPMDCELRLIVLGNDNDIERRDALHALINSLPDPNYATLRALVLVSFQITASLLP